MGAAVQFETNIQPRELLAERVKNQLNSAAEATYESVGDSEQSKIFLADMNEYVGSLSTDSLLEKRGLTSENDDKIWAYFDKDAQYNLKEPINSIGYSISDLSTGIAKQATTDFFNQYKVQKPQIYQDNFVKELEEKTIKKLDVINEELKSIEYDERFAEHLGDLYEYSSRPNSYQEFLAAEIANDIVKNAEMSSEQSIIASREGVYEIEEVADFYTQSKSEENSTNAQFLVIDNDELEDSAILEASLNSEKEIANNVKNGKKEAVLTSDMSVVTNKVNTSDVVSWIKDKNQLEFPFDKRVLEDNNMRVLKSDLMNKTISELKELLECMKEKNEKLENKIKESLIEDIQSQMQDNVELKEGNADTSKDEAKNELLNELSSELNENVALTDEAREQGAEKKEQENKHIEPEAKYLNANAMDSAMRDLDKAFRPVGNFSSSERIEMERAFNNFINEEQRNQERQSREEQNQDESNRNRSISNVGRRQKQ